LKQGKIDVRRHIIIPAITADKIVLLSYSENKKRDLGFLIIGNHLHRIESYIRITIGDQDDDSRLIGLLIGELLEIFHAKQKRITDSRSQEILHRRKISEIHGLQLGDDGRGRRRKRNIDKRFSRKGDE